MKLMKMSYNNKKKKQITLAMLNKQKSNAFLQRLKKTQTYYDQVWTFFDIHIPSTHTGISKIELVKSTHIYQNFAINKFTLPSKSG